MADKVRVIQVARRKDKVVLKINNDEHEVIGFSKTGEYQLSIDSARGLVEINSDDPQSIQEYHDMLVNAFRLVASYGGRNVATL